MHPIVDLEELIAERKETDYDDLTQTLVIIDDWVGVKMTLTTPGCGMGGAISNQVRERVLDLPGVHECDVRIVWDPQWTPAMMSPEAKKKLNVMLVILSKQFFKKCPKKLLHYSFHIK